MRKIQFYKILFLICFWVFCAIFITFYDASVLGFESEIEGGHYSFLRSLIAGILACVIGAILLGSLEVLYLGNLLRKKPFGITLLIKTTIYPLVAKKPSAFYGILSYNSVKRFKFRKLWNSLMVNSRNNILNELQPSIIEHLWNQSDILCNVRVKP
jgi:hypothetical protein